ncbi:MAG TPA: choice-of-anchor tandem repeat GloVer-containing protein, partial [Verrucomicrobiae bacterium]|nr:choice-of-anchor tandem repeat GloVer-containing protein [Verrucomicrobiae bacterium]
FTNGLDGAQPRAGLLMLSNTLYGTTSGTDTNSYGTVYSVTTGGSLHSLHIFSTNNEGALTRSGLTLSGGVLYGTTYLFGSNGFGSVYSINTDGTGFTILHNFTFDSDGGNSVAPLVASGNTLFGTTSAGGTNGWGTVFSLSGTSFNVLHTFAGDVDGGKPGGSLAVLGNTLYGTAQQGGSTESDGTVFSVRTNGTGFVVLHTFQGGSDGSMPSGGLVLSGKTAYGTTTFGGTNGNNSGTIYSITVPVLSITNFALVGSNITFNAADGLSNGTYSVLVSTNPNAPFTQWTPVVTTVLSSNGPFTITATNAVNHANPAGFYVLQLQ